MSLRKSANCLYSKISQKFFFGSKSLEKTLAYPIRVNPSNLTPKELDNLRNFRTHRYFIMNELRWRLLLQTGLDFRYKTIFEPGAGVGDQTEWLLGLGVSKVIVSDGREENVSVIKKRFGADERVSILQMDLESLVAKRQGLGLSADIIFLWGVYYHVEDPGPDYPILRSLAEVGEVIALDYLESTRSDYVEDYSDYNPSTSLHLSASRPTESSMVKAIRDNFGYAYFPSEQMNYFDPAAPDTPRKIIVGSKLPLDLPGLIEAKG